MKCNTYSYVSKCVIRGLLKVPNDTMVPRIPWIHGYMAQIFLKPIIFSIFYIKLFVYFIFLIFLKLIVKPFFFYQFQSN